MPLGKAEIEHRFGFHKATVEGPDATLPRHRDIRLKFQEFAEFLDVMVVDGRAKSVMFTELENASMWAHKGVAEEAPLIGEASTAEVLGPEVELVPGEPAAEPLDENSMPLGNVTDIAD